MAMIFGATLQFESGYDAHASLTRLVDATPSQVNLFLPNHVGFPGQPLRTENGGGLGPFLAA
jgi:hypothetical protein